MCNWSTWGVYSRFFIFFIRVALTLLSSSMECCCVFFEIKNKLYLKLKRKENWNLSDMFLGLVRYF